MAYLKFALSFLDDISCLLFLMIFELVMDKVN